MTLQAKGMLEGDVVEMAEISGFYSERRWERKV